MSMNTPQQTVALVGCGRIGTAIATALVAGGHRVLVFEKERVRTFQSSVEVAWPDELGQSAVSLGVFAVAGENTARYPTEDDFVNSLGWTSGVFKDLPVVSLVGGVSREAVVRTVKRPIARCACTCGITQVGAMLLFESGGDPVAIDRMLSLLPHAESALLPSSEFEIGIEVLIIAALQVALKAVFAPLRESARESISQMLSKVDAEAHRMEVAAGTNSAAFRLSATPNGRTRHVAASIFQRRIIDSLIQ